MIFFSLLIRFKIELSHPEQPLLKAKQLFNVHNLLLNRNKDNKGVFHITQFGTYSKNCMTWSAVFKF